MVGMRALGTAALWMIASALAPLQADEAAKPGPEPSGQAQAVSEKQGSAAADGARLFASVCGFCHADGGRKASKGPKLAGSTQSDEYIIDRIKRGKPGRMPGFSSFSDEQIQQLLVYIRSLEP
jgi:mono/diheme cytochrome c family protein